MKHNYWTNILSKMVANISQFLNDLWFLLKYWQIRYVFISSNDFSKSIYDIFLPLMIKEIKYGFRGILLHSNESASLLNITSLSSLCK